MSGDERVLIVMLAGESDGLIRDLAQLDIPGNTRVVLSCSRARPQRTMDALRELGRTVEYVALDTSQIAPRGQRDLFDLNATVRGQFNQR